MPFSFSDLIKMPTAFKYIIFFGVLAGASIPIPFSGILLGEDTSLGNIFFEPVRLGFESLGILINFQSFVILVVIVSVILFAKGINLS